MLTPATIADVEAFLPIVQARKYQPPVPVTYDALVEHLATGPAVAWRDDPSGPPVLLVGLKRFAGLPSVAWFFAARPLGRRLLPACLALRAELARHMAQHPRGIVAQTRVGNVEGRRLARAMGFIALDECDGVIIWGSTAWKWQQSRRSPEQVSASPTPSSRRTP